MLSIASERPAHALAPWRVHLLRVPYLIVVLGIGFFIWPDLVARHAQWELMEGVVQCMLAAFSLLCVLGVRYPLRMLPLLFWELLWKAIWLGAVAYPKWLAGTLDPATARLAMMCLLVLVFPLMIPWDHVARQFLGLGAAGKHRTSP